MSAAPAAKPAEPMAPDVPRPPAYAPIVWMVTGGIMMLVAFALGMALQAGRGGSGGVSTDSGDAIVQAVQHVGPAVMNVDTTFGVSKSSEFLPMPGMGDQPLEGKGTGVVIDSAGGLMLTNAHVVTNPMTGDRAKTIQVTTRDGKKYRGSVLGSDRDSDIAVVRLETKQLPAARLAGFTDESQLPIGQWVIAIGNPYAQANTVTVGVISAVNRTIPVPDPRTRRPHTLKEMIQTDAAINPGNSGGPLCNIHGEVIGINTAIYGIGTGLGFAIPINKAKAIAQQLIANGKILHPYAGLNAESITKDLQADYGLKDASGALITGVTPNSPAAQAQLKEGDVIRSIDGKEIKSRDDLKAYIDSRKVGDVLKVKVLRNGAVPVDAQLKVIDRPANQ
jgi:S1-C subfamily serine protease